MTATIELRDYQNDAVSASCEAWADGTCRQLGVAATGLGKTVVFVALAKKLAGRALILVHRDELVRQTVRKVHELWPEANVGVVKAADDDVHAEVVVASVQTLSRTKRLGKLIGAMTPSEGGLGLARLADPFVLVVVDEAHHTAAQTYRRVLDGLRAGEPTGPLLLGVTATPDRGDGKGLDDLFDKIVWNYDILWGIRSDYLCDVRGLRVVVDNLDLNRVKVSRGDFEQGSAGQAMIDAHAPRQIVAAWLEHAADRQTLAFLPTVASSIEVAHAFRGAGVKAEHIDGTTDLYERQRILRAYSVGEIQVVTNCAVLTEGYDDPRTDCIIQGRPTKSRALFTQMIGRGTRKHPDKTDLLVLDVVGSTATHSLVTIPSLLGADKPKYWDPLGDGTGTLSGIAQTRDDDLVLAGKLRAEEADLFRKGPPIEWLHTGDPNGLDRYETATEPTVVLIEWVDGWRAGLQFADGRKQLLVAEATLEWAQGIAEDAARKVMAGAVALVDRDAPWRFRPPSRKQLDLARKVWLKNYRSYETAGELSDALDAHFKKRKTRK